MIFSSWEYPHEIKYVIGIHSTITKYEYLLVVIIKENIRICNK